MQALVPRIAPKALGLSKGRKPKFEFVLRIIDLNNVPLVSGTSFIKWHLPHSVAADHRGRTSKCNIKDHKVSYEYEKRVPIRLSIDRHGNLQETEIQFEVVQEYSSGGRVERITLGTIKLNLAEYTEQADYDGEDGISRRYLMQDSKINSTLKMGIIMNQIDGDRNFIAPPLKSAPVFGGIAGIIAGEQVESDDVGQMVSLNKSSKESGQVQDLYRRTLSAYWTSQPGDLRADECIEDIFAGGDGWGDKNRPSHAPIERPRVGRNRLTRRDKDRGPTRHDHSVDSLTRTRTFRRGEHRRQSSQGSISTERTRLEQDVDGMKAEKASKPGDNAYEVNEFDFREDLRSWNIPGATS